MSFVFAAALLAAVPEVSTSSVVPPPRAFAVDPIADGTMIGASTAFGLLLELIIRTGELRPQEPLDADRLLAIDRGTALQDEEERSSDLLSNIGVGIAGAYAVVDIALEWILDRGESPLAYAFMYVESATINLAVLNLVKIAVRRPRPIAYRELRRTGMVSEDTNSALSFYSGHTAIVAGIAATATYLAFERDEIEGWVVALVGAALVAGVGVQRVRGGAHFPTDVIAGALAGASVGVLVPHLHRTAPPIRLGAMPIDDGAGLAVGGTF